MSEDTEEDRIASLDDRFSGIEEQQAKQQAAIDKILGIVSGSVPDAPEGVQQRTQDRLAGRSVADEVADELRRRDESKAREQKDAEHESLKEQVAKLAEQPPRAPERRVTRVLWGPQS